MDQSAVAEDVRRHQGRRGRRRPGRCPLGERGDAVATPDVSRTRTFNLGMSLLKAPAPEKGSLAYDRRGDTLIVAFTQDSRLTVGVAAGDYFLLRVDPATEQ